MLAKKFSCMNRVGLPGCAASAYDAPPENFKTAVYSAKPVQAMTGSEM